MNLRYLTLNQGNRVLRVVFHPESHSIPLFHICDNRSWHIFTSLHIFISAHLHSCPPFLFHSSVISDLYKLQRCNEDENYHTTTERHRLIYSCCLLDPTTNDCLCHCNIFFIASKPQTILNDGYCHCDDFLITGVLLLKTQSVFRQQDGQMSPSCLKLIVLRMAHVC